MSKKTKKEIPVYLNNEYELLINNITSTGEGISQYKGFTIFIDNAVPGDTVLCKIVKIKSNYAVGKIIKILSKSPTRVKNDFCPYEDLCGGCSYSKVNYENQLKFKQQSVKDALERIGGFKDLNIQPIIASKESSYRNKAQFKVNKNGIGFYKKGTHDLINLDSCFLQTTETNYLMKELNNLIKKYNISIYNEKTHQGLLRGILIRTNRENEFIIVLIINGDKLPNQELIINDLKSLNSIVGIYLNINKNKGNKILGNKEITLYKTKDLIETLGTKSFKISPNSFFQVNTEQTEKLYNIVKEYADIQKNETVLDLYCGTGTIGIYVSDNTNKLIGVEIVEDAIKDAIENAKLNNLVNYEFYQGKAEEVISKLTDKPTCIILDPPRKGCDSNLLDYLLKIKVPRIVYISCNPTTLARDLKILSEDYKIEKVQPIDLFPQTGHVETVVLLIKK